MQGILSVAHLDADPMLIDVRFGSADFAAEVLPDDLRSEMLKAVAAIRQDNAISVLVQAAPEQVPGSKCCWENALVRLFTFQVRHTANRL